MRRASIVVAIAASLLTLNACGFFLPSDLQYCPAISSQYLLRQNRVIVDDTVQRFNSFDLEKQYQIYTCSMETFEPPLTHFIEPFAAEGANAVPFLTDKLRSSRNDGISLDIVMVFAAMSDQGTYNVRSDRRLMSLIEQKVSSFHSDFLRREGAELLRQISSSHE